MPSARRDVSDDNWEIWRSDCWGAGLVTDIGISNISNIDLSEVTSEKMNLLLGVQLHVQTQYKSVWHGGDKAAATEQVRKAGGLKMAYLCLYWGW